MMTGGKVLLAATVNACDLEGNIISLNAGGVTMPVRQAAAKGSEDLLIPEISPQDLLGATAFASFRDLGNGRFAADPDVFAAPFEIEADPEHVPSPSDIEDMLLGQKTVFRTRLTVSDVSSYFCNDLEIGRNGLLEDRELLKKICDEFEDDCAYEGIDRATLDAYRWVTRDEAPKIS